MADTPRIGITELEQAVKSKYLTINSAFQLLDALVQASVEDKDLTAPPAHVHGNTYIVGGSATGDWSGEDNNIAQSYNAAWYFYEPEEGYSVYVKDEDELYFYNGSGWVKYTENLNTLKCGDVAGGDYLEIEADGTLVLHGDATGYKDRNFSGVAAGNPAQSPDFVDFDTTGIKLAAFDGNATEESLHAGTEINHTYEEGTDPTFHVHWAATDNNAGNVKWQMEIIIINGGTVRHSSTISAVQAATGTAWEEQRLNIGTLTGTTFTIGDQIGMRIFRDPADVADTYGSDAAITFTFGYHYKIDTPAGSRQITTK